VAQYDVCLTVFNTKSCCCYAKLLVNIMSNDINICNRLDWAVLYVPANTV